MESSRTDTFRNCDVFFSVIFKSLSAICNLSVIAPVSASEESANVKKMFRLSYKVPDHEFGLKLMADLHIAPGLRIRA